MKGEMDLHPSNPFLFLTERKSLVRGAKNSIILDFANEKIHNVDSTLSDIIQLGERNYRIHEAVEKIGLNQEKTMKWLTVLERRGLIYISDNERKVARQKSIPPKMTFLWLEMTGRCNLNCAHCYVDAKKGLANSFLDLPKKKIKEVLVQASDIGCHSLQLTGGEPTLRKDLREVIGYADDLGFFIEVFTNATLLSDTMLSLFRRKDVHVATSFYSHKKEVHDSITGVVGSYERSLRAIKALVENDIKHRCEVIRMKANDYDFNETVNFLLELGVSTYKQEYILPIGRGKRQARGSYNEYDYCPGKWPPIIPPWEYKKRRQWNGCWFGKAAVCYNGDVLPCIFARDQIAGNVFKDSLQSVVYGRLLDYWGINKDKVETCRDCEYRYNCHDCPPLIYALTGRLDCKPPICKYDPHTGEWAS